MSQCSLESAASLALHRIIELCTISMSLTIVTALSGVSMHKDRTTLLAREQALTSPNLVIY